MSYRAMAYPRHLCKRRRGPAGPAQLFKYCDENGINILRYLTLKITPPNKLNDPFEMLPAVRVVTPKAFALRNVHRYPDQGKVAAALQNLTASERQAMSIDVLHFFSRRSGVACFSDDPAHVLMWSHYSNAHRGLVIEFDPGYALFRPGLLVKVTYHTERAVLDPSTQDAAKEAEALVKWKDIRWGYEREYRLVLPFAGIRSRSRKAREGYYLRIDGTAIKSVTLGVLTPIKLKNSVRGLLKRPFLSHVELWAMQLDPKAYKLHRERITS